MKTRRYDKYGIRHLSSHLHEAGMGEDLYHLVFSKEWYQCSLDFASSGQLYREDIRIAFLSATEQIESMAHLDDLSTIGTYLVRPAVLALISASLVQAVKRVPLSVLQAMIRLGDKEQALQLVEAIPNPIERAKFLITIGQTMSELGGHPDADSLWNQARKLLLSSPSDFFNEKYEALSQLVHAHARAGQAEEALSLAETLQREAEGDERGAISTAQTSLVNAWAAVGNIERSLAAAHALTDHEGQITALCSAAAKMLTIDPQPAMDILDKALELSSGVKQGEALFKLSQALAEAGRLADAWRVAGKNVNNSQRSRILMAAARGAQRSGNLVTGRHRLRETLKTVVTVESEEERLMLLIELAMIGTPLINGKIADTLRVLINQLWKKPGIGLDREKQGKIALGLLSSGDSAGAREAVSASIDWQLPKDDWEENDAMIELSGLLVQSGDIAGLDWVLSRAKQRQAPRQKAELAYHAAKAFTKAGALAQAKEAEQLMLAAALKEPTASYILAVWREENIDSPSLQTTPNQLLDQALKQLEESSTLTDGLAEIALKLAKEKKFLLANRFIQQLLESIKDETDPNTLARVIGLIAEVAAEVSNHELLNSLKASAKAIDVEWLQAEALCWIAGWQAVMGRYPEARKTYFEVICHDHELWQPVNPVDIEAALQAGDMEWMVEIASDIGWPTAETAAIFAGLAIALEQPGPRWLEVALHAIDNITEGYNSVRTYCHRMIIGKITGEPDPLETALTYWLGALEHSSKRDSGETWAVISSALPFFHEHFKQSFTRSLWLELAQAHQLLY